MRIAQLLTSAGDGGLEKHVRELSIEMAEQGHEVIVLAPKVFLETLPENLIKVQIPAHLSRHHPWLFWQIYRHLKQYKIDVIHAQANKAVSILAKLKWLLKTPCIGTLHNIKKRSQVFKKMDHIIAVSKRLSASFDSSQATTIYNGIRPPKPININIHSEFGLHPNLPTLCAIGRLVNAKGFDILIQAVTNIDVNLVIVGNGPDEDKLAKLINAEGLSDRIKLVGFREDAISIMNASDGVVISSRREGFSYVFSEAILLNKPVIATDVPVANELLPAHLIVPTENIEALSVGILQCLNQPTDWQDQITSLHKQIGEELSLATMSQKTISVYQSLIDNHQENS